MTANAKLRFLSRGCFYTAQGQANTWANVLITCAAVGCRTERYMLAYREQHTEGRLRKRTAAARLALSLRDDAEPQDILTGILQAAYLRRLLSSRQNSGAELASSSLQASSAAQGDDLGSTSGREPHTPAGGRLDGWRTGLKPPHRESNLLQRQSCRNPAPAGRLSPHAESIAAEQQSWHEHSDSQLHGAPVDGRLLEGAMRLSHDLAKRSVPALMSQMQACEWQTHPFMLSSVERAAYRLSG